MRQLLVPVLAVALLAPGPAALAQSSGDILPLTFQPVSMAMYDAHSEYAFFPSKGIEGYQDFDEPPMGYIGPSEPGQAGRNTQYFLNTDDEQNTNQIFALIRIKVINYFPRNIEIDGANFYLEGKQDDIYPPHPFTIATTHLLLVPHQASFLDLGFDVPGGKYSLYYKTPTSLAPDLGGKLVADEIWRYDITIDRGPVTAIFRLVPELVTRYVGAIFSFLGGLLGLND